jgi:hypothetical protein
MSEVKPAHYFLDPLAPFPPRWRDKTGPITVMAGPVKGYVMVRRPNAVPFVLHVSDLCNATKHPRHGPFEVVRAKTRRASPICLASTQPPAHHPMTKDTDQ